MNFFFFKCFQLIDLLFWYRFWCQYSLKLCGNNFWYCDTLIGFTSHDLLLLKSALIEIKTQWGYELKLKYVLKWGLWRLCTLPGNFNYYWLNNTPQVSHLTSRHNQSERIVRLPSMPCTNSAARWSAYSVFLRIVRKGCSWMTGPRTLT